MKRNHFKIQCCAHFCDVFVSELKIPEGMCHPSIVLSHIKGSLGNRGSNHLEIKYYINGPPIEVQLVFLDNNEML